MDNRTRTQAEASLAREMCYSRKMAGKYPLVREISRGGMGIVYESFQKELKRRVAVKILPLIACGSEESTERFRREAATVAKIRHSGVAQVYDFGRDEACYFIVMEYIEGSTLEEKIRQGPVSREEAVSIVKNVSLILHDLHGQGIIHRDIKPSNIMMRSDGRIVLLDFGISKCLDDENLYNITHQPIGTPAYMPPEYIRSSGKESDERSDVYSLGVVLFEMTAGSLPFEKEGSYYDILHKILSADIKRPRQVCPDMPAELETVILKCMAFSPHARYGSVRELAGELERLERKEHIGTSRFSVLLRHMVFSSRIKRRVAGLLFAFLMLFLAYVFFSPRRQEVISSEVSWKRAALFPTKDALKDIRVFRGIEGELEIKAREQFVSIDAAASGLTWLRNIPGYLVFGEKFAGDVRLSFFSRPPESGELFGAFISSAEALSGYILKIEKGELILCKGYHESVLKQASCEEREEGNLYVLERVGPEVNVWMNGKKVINFIDYNPYTSDENCLSGLFFQKGFREIKDLQVFEPRQMLAVSPIILGQKLFEVGQYEKAIREFEKIIGEYPLSDIAVISRFKVGMCYKEMQKLDKAVAAFDKILSTARSGEVIAETYFQKGICLYLLGNEDWAEEIFFKTIQDHRGTDVALNIFLFLYEKLSEKIGKDFRFRDVPQYEKRYFFILDNFPSQRALLTADTRVFIEKLIRKGFFDRALHLIGVLPEYFPSHVLTLAWAGLRKGDIYAELKDYEKAEKAYMETSQVYKGFDIYEVMALSKLGTLYLKEEKIDEAEKVFQTIVRDHRQQLKFTSEAEINLKYIKSLKRASKD